MDIKKSIYFRAKRFVEQTKLDLTLSRNNITQLDVAPNKIEFLETMETVKNYLKSTTTMLDIGAHQGLFSKIAQAFYPFKRTICFEPNPNMHEKIKANNPKNTEIADIALSSQVGTTTFHLHEDNTMNSLVDVNKELLKKEFPYDNPDKLKSIEVKTTTLDLYTKTKNLQEETFFIKIDTQGNELNILKKGINTLIQTEVILIEYMFTNPYESDFTFMDLHQFLEENNFECKGALSISRRPSKKISAVDFIFVKK